MPEGVSGVVCDELFDCVEHLRERERAGDDAVDSAPVCAQEYPAERMGEGAYLVDIRAVEMI
jgi:hypothetical protein